MNGHPAAQMTYGTARIIPLKSEEPPTPRLRQAELDENESQAQARFLRAIFTAGGKIRPGHYTDAVDVRLNRLSEEYFAARWAAQMQRERAR